LHLHNALDVAAGFAFDLHRRFVLHDLHDERQTSKPLVWGGGSAFRSVWFLHVVGLFELLLFLRWAETR
jgi:hypothetical protein